jgi:ribosomal protein S25
LDTHEIKRKKIFKSVDEQRKILRKLKEDGIIEAVSGTYGAETIYRRARGINKNQGC